jgi:pre-rRNA-processing protein TSR1
MRTSAWDPKESLPPDYARVFAFEDFRRAHKRAREAAARASSDADPCAVSPGKAVP